MTKRLNRPYVATLGTQIECALRSGWEGYSSDLAARFGVTDNGCKSVLRDLEARGIATRDLRIKEVPGSRGIVDRRVQAHWWRLAPPKPVYSHQAEQRRAVLMRSRDHMGPLLTVWQGAAA